MSASVVVENDATPKADKPAQTKQFLEEILRLAQWPARLEMKELEDGGIAVALHFEKAVAGITQGKRSHLLESLQFLLNKVVNKPGADRRWVSLGAGDFPAPRGPRMAPAPSPAAENPAPAQAPAPPAKANPRGAKPTKGAHPEPAARPVDEPKDVPLSEEWKKLGTELKDKAIKHGRPYAVMMLSPDERAQLQKAVAGADVKVAVEGEGHFRRVAVVPHRLVPMPRKMQFPDDEDEGDA